MSLNDVGADELYPLRFCLSKFTWNSNHLKFYMGEAADSIKLRIGSEVT